MKFKYRVKGKVTNAFILRGLHFAFEDCINFDISDKELEFVKAHCDLKNIIDLEKEQQTSPKPVLEEQEIENKPKGEIENVESHKSNGGRKPKVKVSD